MRRVGVVVLAALALPILIGGAIATAMLGETKPPPAEAACNGPGLKIDPATIPNITVDGYGPEQILNAAYIIKAGEQKEATVRDQTIAVMTAMGESGLVNIGYGDWETGGVTNPDGSPTTSLGLFQQQAGWGTVDERMDPLISATKFYDAMFETVPAVERKLLPPSIVAHRTQANSDPFHYEKYWTPAVNVVNALATTKIELGEMPSVGCAAATPGVPNKEGWAKPSDGPAGDGFGPREAIWTDGGWSSSFHLGVDLAPGCDAPIWAAHDGVVVFSGIDTWGNGRVTIDHGGGITTEYLHMYESGIFVREGDTVKAGQHIAAIGNTGQSSGCHLHFVVNVDGESIDPEIFLAERGIVLR